MQTKQTQKKCPRCKEAISLKNYKQHVDELECDPFKNLNEANRCPLCHVDIPPNDLGWKQHLLTETCLIMKDQLNFIFYLSFFQ